MLNSHDQKYYGKVYTPVNIVELMLSGIFAKALCNRKICDPACGTGDFLAPVVQEVCLRIRRGGDKQAHLNTLKNLTGYDVDSHAVKECRARLTQLANESIGDQFTFTDDYWRILNVNALEVREDFGFFDYVIGNPPYVRIQNLERCRRDQIRNGNWRYFTGSSDLYIIFYELALQLLKPGGELIYIAPSSWLRNEAGCAMRADIEGHYFIKQLYDFGDYQVFPGVTTYTAIVNIVKNASRRKTKAYKLNREGEFCDKHFLQKSNLCWSVVSNQFKRGFESKRSDHVPLREIANIHVGIQTLADRVFILEVKKHEADKVECKVNGANFLVETKAVRRVYKASALKNGKDKVNRVAIYPYQTDGSLIEEQEFADMYPLAYQWLLHNKKRLLSRDKHTFDRNKWHGYERDVSILSGYGEKILTSGMNPKPNFQYCGDKDTLFYSGYCVKPKSGVDIQLLISELNSKRMEQYIRQVSQPFQGGWYSYAKRYIQDFPVSVKVCNVE